MSPYIHDDFLLSCGTSRDLYHQSAALEPILDYHSHLSVADIAIDRRWDNLAELWLGGDHYKWRQMRANGVEERFCTGAVAPFEKFQAWAAVLPKALRNPLHHWTHIEMARFFGITDLLLSPETAGKVWERANAVIASPEFTCRSILRKMNVKALCTTDDPCDSLEHHDQIRKSGFDICVFPTYRPDKAFGIGEPDSWNLWMDGLEKSAGMRIARYADLQIALRKRRDAFHERGCRIADHGLTYLQPAVVSERELNRLFGKIRSGRRPSPEEIGRYRFGLLCELGRIYAEKDWAWMLHLGALRNVNSRMAALLGPDTGFDVISSVSSVEGLAALFDVLNTGKSLPRTLVFNLHPSENDAFAVLAGAFQEAPVRAKIQCGPGWWFLDQKKGMEDQLDSLSYMGLLGHFVGMTTDSRSFLSFSRHEYFRRILCEKLGREREAGLLPDEGEALAGLVRDISFRNAKEWFSLPVA